MSRQSLIINAKYLREHQTKAEAILWEWLRKYKLAGYKFRRQHPIGNYIADFYCPQAKLVIEVDGKIHDESEVKEYDKIRQIAIESTGITVIRFKNEEIIETLETVLLKIEAELEKAL